MTKLILRLVKKGQQKFGNFLRIAFNNEKAVCDNLVSVRCRSSVILVRNQRNISVRYVNRQGEDSNKAVNCQDRARAPP